MQARCSPDEGGHPLHGFADRVQSGPGFGSEIISVDDFVRSLRLVDAAKKHEFVLDHAPGGTRATRWHVRKSVPLQFLFAVWEGNNKTALQLTDTG